MTVEPILEPGDAGPPDWQDDENVLADVDAYLRGLETAEELALDGSIYGTAEDSVREPERGSFAERVSGRRVDLFALIELGVPPVEYLPASEGMFVKRKRHTIAAPRKLGKTLSQLVHTVHMALAGARVVILDRENGSAEYARRLEQIMAGLSLGDDAEKQELRERLSYFEFPRLRIGDGADFVAMCAGLEADCVVFDSQRKFLTDLGLAEGDSDDYATFMAEVVDPLFEAGIATIVLDNTGHKEMARGRGTSAKGDLHEVLFKMEIVEPFSLSRVGKVRLVLEAGDSRFGNEGAWTMTLGGGVFGSWELQTSAEQILEQQERLQAERQAWEDEALDQCVQIVTDYFETHRRGMSKADFEREFVDARNHERGAVTLARRVFDRARSEWEVYELKAGPRLANGDPSESEDQTATQIRLAVVIGERSHARQLIPFTDAGSRLAVDPNDGDGDPTEDGPSNRRVAGSPLPIGHGHRHGDLPATSSEVDAKSDMETDDDCLFRETCRRCGGPFRRGSGNRGDLCSDCVRKEQA